ncbi:aldose 1-epimerase family protein [Acutalibacter sp. 1XD8-33]|uniref:aldose 1-epimerase family protein n=1 Tax=Acutalibacter sp. 1XD8-33 TaxID=2320081 RepID=UPI001FA9FF57|nr:aldose 1-epimerase family protein [Acutalibacter sp. 1XD8-33]
MLHTIRNEILTVSIHSLGAQLSSIRANGTEYLWQGDPEIWADQAPVLFPYVARLTKEQYHYGGETYSLPIHGFAKDSEFAFSQESPQAMAFSLSDSPETRRAYPFPFRFTVSYRLEGNRLIQGFLVENPGPDTMFFGLGGHPGFRVPLEEGLRFEDYRVELSPEAQPVRVGFTPQCFLNGQDKPYPLESGVLPLSHSLFDEDAIVLREPGCGARLYSPRGGRAVAVDFPGFPYLGLWHRPHTSAPYVCIEPWCSLPSRQDLVEDLAEQPSLLSLPAGETLGREIIFTFD